MHLKKNDSQISDDMFRADEKERLKTELKSLSAMTPKVPDDAIASDSTEIKRQLEQCQVCTGKMTVCKFGI